MLKVGCGRGFLCDEKVGSTVCFGVCDCRLCLLVPLAELQRPGTRFGKRFLKKYATCRSCGRHNKVPRLMPSCAERRRSGSTREVGHCPYCGDYVRVRNTVLMTLLILEAGDPFLKKCYSCGSWSWAAIVW